MKAQIKLGRVFGVEIGLHYSWFIIALLITFSLADQFRLNNPRWSDSLRWGLALVTAMLFFVSIVAHELSHALVAKARGLPVRAITLFALGGVAQIEKEAADAKTEFWMGIVGPITSAPYRLRPPRDRPGLGLDPADRETDVHAGFAATGHARV